MQTSSVRFNTKPLLFAPVKAKSSHSAEPSYSSSSLFSGHKHNWVHQRKAISLRPQRYPRSRAYLTTSKNPLRRYSSDSNDLSIRLKFLDRCKYVSCFRHQQRKCNIASRFRTGDFFDKSTFHLTKQSADDSHAGNVSKHFTSLYLIAYHLPHPCHGKFNFQMKQVYIPCATVGPDEPHAASTTWPDGVLEKQGLDLLDPEHERSELEHFLSLEVPSHPKLYRGQLRNGLRYIILPNKVSPNRFKAHMEVHVGSIDEDDDEQGILRMIKHVAFLGSKKREKLLETGARSNAYTDFHHTVFHIHSPTSIKDSNDELLPVVLDALNEIAFHPKFLASRVEKERWAILLELKMMNTIECRVDCQLLQHLHSESKLSKRFPIGLEEQIMKWDADKISLFHERWHFPANATLYIVGDIDNISKTVHHIENVFGQIGVENETASPPAPSAFGAVANFLVPSLQSDWLDISCIKDLTSLYEAANIGDIYLAYERLKIDENSLYS